MTTPTSTDASIPRYLRYKAEDKQADDYWDEELERANTILHGRVLLMHRDKLCSGCARFDWIRTQLYTREAILYDRELSAEHQKVKNSAERPLPWSETQRHFHGVEDNVSWHSYKFTQEADDRIKLLADHPRFEWEIADNDLSCILCEALRSTLATILSDNNSSRSFGRGVLELAAGHLFEEGGEHRCSEVN
ncbi:hypothetical protein CC86DRAFT_125621 [Ophiobolus disseminans]|uniref:Uncharacterized protein n=1 Tax=Ophiobolus disseminans TaxID=1469910 RepID=A0A6A6ZII1_9PLEO|nr:hypothetical protein CC86DRAFT_125621 [Ophiobolus disseminans]